MEVVLEIRNLRTSLTTPEGKFFPVDDVSFVLELGKTTALVGESGCGKSMTAMSLLQLLPPIAKIESGEILFNLNSTRERLPFPQRDRKHSRLKMQPSLNLAQLSEEELQVIRGGEIGVVFQEPMSALNPVFTIGNQLTEMLDCHFSLTKLEGEKKAISLLGETGIPEPEARLKCYPHELSGGMRQRAMIAMAIACNPRVLIADEPTTALDVTIQAQILDLLAHLQQTHHMAMLLITHDLGVVAEFADSVNVMYGGKIVESASAETLFRDPHHPYTKGLLQSIPTLKSDRKKELFTISGTVPPLSSLPSGCVFEARCSKKFAKCHEERPNLLAVGDSKVACHNPW